MIKIPMSKEIKNILINLGANAKKEDIELLERRVTHISINYGLFATRPVYLIDLYEAVKEDTMAEPRIILLFLRKLLNGMENQNYLSFEVANDILMQMYKETKHRKHFDTLRSFYVNQKYYLQEQYREISFEYFN